MSNTKEDNNLILNLIKQVKSIGYQLTALQSSPGILRKEEFEYTGSQVFTTSENYAQVFLVGVKGVGPLSESQYTLTPPNTVTILDTLEPTDFVVIIYSQTLPSTLPYYTQAEIDAMLLALETLLKDYTDDSFVRGARLYARTGIVDKTDQFKLDVFDANTITIGIVDNALFWDKLFEIDVDPNTAIRSFTELPYPLTELITATGLNTNTDPIVSDGIYVRYLGYDIQGGVVSSPDSFIENSAVVQLGFTTVVKSGSSITFLGGVTPGARNVFSQPILANLNDLDRITVTTATDITVGYNIGTPTLNTNPGVITGISINWRTLTNPTNSSSVDKFNYLGDNIVDFVSIDANFLTDTSAPVIHTLWTDLAEGVAINQSFYNTTTTLRDTLDVGSYSVKRVLVGVRGGIFIQDGEHSTSAAFTTLDIAKANVYTHSFTNAIVPEGLVIEIARIIFKESVTDFSDETQFIIVGTIGGTSSGGSLVSVGDATPTVKGVLKLAGDLSGTADLPTVPGLLTKADDSTVVHLSGTETIVGAKTFSSLVTAAGYKIPLGTASQYLMADGSVSTLSTVTLQSAYNSSTPNPEILTNNVNNALTIRQGSGSDDNTIFQGMNGIGQLKFYVRGNGTLSASSNFSPSYNVDGLFNVNSAPSFISTPGGKSVSFGYLDYGSGQYHPRIGFDTTSKWSMGIVGSGGLDFSIGLGNGITDHLTIKNGGNTLIGTTTDDVTNKLQVNGSTKITGNLIVTGSSNSLIGVGTNSPRISAGFSNITLEGSAGGSVHFRGSGSTELGGIYGSDASGIVVRTTNITSPISLAINDLTKLRISINGNTLLNTIVDNGIDRLQVAGSANINGNYSSAIGSGVLKLTVDDTYTSLAFGSNSVNLNLATIQSYGRLSNNALELGLNPNGGNVLIGGTISYTGTKFLVSGSGLFYGGTADPGDGSPAGTRIGFDTTSQYGFIQSMQTGVANKPLWLNRGASSSSGTVIVGGTTNNGVDIFQVNGSLNANTIKKTGGLATEYLMANGSVSTGPSPSLTTNIQTGTTYTLLSTDNGLQIIFTNAAAITLTIPSGLPSGFNCEVLQRGTGQITFTGSGTTLRYSSFETPTTAEQYSLVGIDNIVGVTEEFHLYGSLTSI